MVNLSSDGIRSAAYNTVHEDLVGDIEEEEAVGAYSGRSEGVCLAWGTGESIKEPSVGFAVFFGETIGNLLFVI